MGALRRARMAGPVRSDGGLAGDRGRAAAVPFACASLAGSQDLDRFIGGRRAMSNANAPVFIGGLSGSGKTQLRMVVGAHPAISMTRRTYMWERYYRRFGDLRDPRHLDRCLSTMCVDPGVRQLAPDRARIEREFAGGPHRYALLFALFHRHHAERSGKQRWGDQLGFVERFADPIFESIPGACMVHMVRDPRERVVAGTRGVLLGKVGWETARWIRSAELARRNEHRYGASYLVVHYEDLAD